MNTTLSSESAVAVASQGAAAEAVAEAVVSQGDGASAGMPVDSLSFLSTVRPDFWEAFG
ncbi:MAG: hypothetical protein K2M55_01350 [Muribaculaceae bacterium]|nr:hypothetical protein [Muribaculaceae bacterium]